jgi:hypothetical protein
MVATVVIVALVIFAAGAVTAVTLLASYGIQREERNYSLTRQAPGVLSAGTRRLTGLYVRKRSDPDPEQPRGTDIYV